MPARADDSNYATSSAPSADTWNVQPPAMSTTLPPTGSDLPVRQELVARIRRAIQEGRYETPEKWAITLRRLLEILSPADAPLNRPMATVPDLPSESVDNRPPQLLPTPPHE